MNQELKYNPISIEEIYEKGKNLDVKDRALYYFLYLTGARISEALKIKKSDISIKNNGEIILINLFTLKNKRRKRRKIPIIMKGFEGKMLKFFIGYVYLRGIDNKEKIFEGNRQAICNRFKRRIRIKGFKLYPHYLRHCRLTHLAKKGFTEPYLTEFAGWSDPRPAKYYIHLDWRDIANRMMNK